MILIYHLTQHPTEPARRSGRLLHDIETGHLAGTITTWTRSEYLGVMRKLLAKTYNRNPTAAEMQTAENNFDSLITRLGLELQDADVLIGQGGQTRLFAESDSLLRNSSASRKRSSGEWTTIGGADSIHGVLARRAGAQELATFDEGFRGANFSGVTTFIVGDRY